MKASILLVFGITAVLLIATPIAAQPTPSEVGASARLRSHLSLHEAERKRQAQHAHRIHSEVGASGRLRPGGFSLHEAERKRQARLARRANEEAQQLIERERRATLPGYRIWAGDADYSFIQMCHEAPYALAYINDVELQRARSASKAIENLAIAEDPTIDRDKQFALSDEYARSVFSRLSHASDALRSTCREVLHGLLASSPVSPYNTQTP